VDTFSHNGEHRVLMTGFELVGNPHPVVVCTGVPAPLTPEQHAKVGSTVTAALTALGVLTGPAHTEVLVDGQDVFLVETQLRPGGDFPELTQAVTGLDAYQLWADQLLGGNPLPSIDRARPPERATAAVMMWGGPGARGTYESVRGISEMQNRSDVKWVHVIQEPPVASKLPVEALEDVPVGVLCVGSTVHAALRRAQRALQGVSMRVSQDPCLPVVPASHRPRAAAPTDDLRAETVR
jgi:biotin carboxylase